VELRCLVSSFGSERGAGSRRSTASGFKKTATLSLGDFLNFEEGEVDLGAHGDDALLGVCQETLVGVASTTTIRVITDSDAVYGVEDDNARSVGEVLDLTGATGLQGVARGTDSELLVVLECTAQEETLVRINAGRHHRVVSEPGVLTGGELNAAVARAVVRYHRQHTGRGPTKAQAFYRGNTLVVVLGDVLSQAERSLADAGRGDVVKPMRMALQEMMRGELTATIEALTACRVLAFMSANSLDPDMAAEVFVLDRPLPRQAAEPPQRPGE
jgi:uncharacterized protein YbcI